MVTGDEDLMIINNTINHVHLHTQQVTCSYQLGLGMGGKQGKEKKNAQSASSYLAWSMISVREAEA